MVLVESNKVKRLLHLSFIGHVQTSELHQGHAELAALLAGLPPGFRLLTDLSHLTSMDLACRDGVAHAMELCEKNGIGMVIRVIPEPQKDIGFNILSAFHYKRSTPVCTCQSLEDALRLLDAPPPAK